MALRALQSELQTQARGGGVRLFAAMSAAGMPAAAGDQRLVLTQLMASGGELSIAGASQVTATDDAVSFDGAADVLGLVKVPVRVSVTAASAVQVVVTPAEGWTFASSFPLTAGSGATQVTLARVAFVLTTLEQGTHDWTDSVGTARRTPLSRGLTFVSDLTPGGVLDILGQLLSGPTEGLHIPFTGPLDVSPLAQGRPSPSMVIAGPIAASLKAVEYFGLGAPQVELRTLPQAPGDPPWLCLAVPLSRNGRALFTVTAPLFAHWNILTLGGWPENGGGLSLADICDLAAGTEVTASMPDFLADVFSSVGLKDFQVTLVVPSMKVLSLGVGVGATRPWSLGPFKVDDLRLGFMLSEPFGPGRQHAVAFTATLEMFPTLFQGRFELEISTGNGGDWLVGAGFSGDVSLNALVSEISNHAVTVPQDVASITFQDFSVHFAREGGVWSWTLYGTSDATFPLPLVNGHAKAALTAVVSSTEAGYGFSLKGTLEIGQCLFMLDADMQAERKLLKGSWSMRNGQTLGITDLAAAVHLPAPPIPPELDLALVSATLEYDLDHRVFLVTARSRTYGQAVFVADSSGQALFAFGVDIHLGLELANLPLVGDKLPSAENLGIDTASVWLLSRPVQKPDARTINALLDSVGFKPLLPVDGVDSSVLLGGDFLLGPGDTLSLRLPLGGGTPRPAPETDSTPAAALPAPAQAASAQPATGAAPASGNGTTWLNVQRQFGTFQFNRIGIGYSSGVLTFSLDAGVTLGPFALSMDGLSVGSPLTDFKPVFNLDGLGLSFEQEPVSISGALLKVPADRLAPQVELQFDGSVSVRVRELGIAGLGSYARMKSGEPSMFLFAQVTEPLGGPPAFFVTGLMGGVGFNRDLALPDLDEVGSFPLLLLGRPPAPGEPVPRQDPMQVQRILEGEESAPGVPARQWLVPRTGAFWLAAGIQFTSFKLVNTRALVVLQLTDTFTLALLGLSSVQLPVPAENSPTYAYAELQLRAVFQPRLGVFAASAVLSNTSYVLSPDCHLTGGFAVSCWYAPSEHAGDFVMTLGGYHPAFKVPSHYPRVPRLGFNWPVSGVVSIKGSAYCALTPSCAMAGGGLEVLFHDGALKAWFTAHADFLLSWRPFFYTARIDVSIGVSYRLNLGICHKTLSLSVGASMDMWGPPTGGRVHVHLVVVSFTVRFGSDGTGKNHTPLAWEEFTALLPDHSSICTATPGPRLLTAMDSDASTSRQRWVVRPRGFSFATQSAIPATTLRCEGASHSATSTRPVSIRPMNKANVSSTHTVKLSRQSPDAEPMDVSAWRFEPRSQTLPASLWSAPPVPFSQTPATPSSDTLRDMLVGFTITTPEPAMGQGVGPVARGKLAEEYLSPPGQAPLSTSVQPDSTYLPSSSTETVARIATTASGPARDARDALREVLRGSGIHDGGGDFTAMATQAAQLFADAPMQQA